MTDLRTELGGIISNFQVSVEGMEYSDKGKVNYYNKQLEEALAAILKLIEERYVEKKIIADFIKELFPTAFKIPEGKE